MHHQRCRTSCFGKKIHNYCFLRFTLKYWIANTHLFHEMTLISVSCATVVNMQALEGAALASQIRIVLSTEQEAKTYEERYLFVSSNNHIHDKHHYYHHHFQTCLTSKRFALNYCPLFRYRPPLESVGTIPHKV